MKKSNSILKAETRAILVARFPLAFMPPRTFKKPLKIGIRADIVRRCPDLDRRQIGITLGDYCYGAKYLVGLVAGTQRVDLDGNPAGIVEPSHEAYAAGRLAKCKFPVPRQEAAE